MGDVVCGGVKCYSRKSYKTSKLAIKIGSLRKLFHQQTVVQYNTHLCIGPMLMYCTLAGTQATPPC